MGMDVLLVLGKIILIPSGGRDILPGHEFPLWGGNVEGIQIAVGFHENF